MELHHSSEPEAPEKVTKLFLNTPLVAHCRRDRCRLVGPLTEILRPHSAFVKSDLIGFPHGLGCRGPNLQPSPRSNRTPERVLTTRSPRGDGFTSRPTMAWRIVSIGRPATTPNAIFAKR